ncbi:MAG: hypothetical protein WC254_02410 [Candidatus Woesearchaeota archaeon]|jgi:hypothetical protein
MQKNNMDTKKLYKKMFLIIIIIFLLYKTIDYFGAIGYRETWNICLDYISQGTLWIGQPHCEGAILPFYIISLLDTIVGREYTQIAVIIFSTIISIIFFWIFIKVVKKELNEEDFFWPGLFFGLFFYINMITNVEAILNSFFFFFAYYVLFHTEWKNKEYLTGILLLCALLSKINVVIQIAFLLFWYSYTTKMWYFEDKKLKIQFKQELFWQYGKIIMPVIMGFTILTLIYDYFWIYSWDVFTNQTIALSTLQTLKELIFFNINSAEINYLPILIIVGISIYLFYKENKFYTFMSGPVFLLAIFLIARAFDISSVTGLRYWSVIFPFVILSLLRLKQLWVTAPQKQIMQGLLLLLLVYPGLYYGPLLFKDDLSYIDSMNFIDRYTKGWQEKDMLIKQIHYGYSIIPEQEGRILLEDDPAVFKRRIISFGSNIPYENIDFLTRMYMESHPDVWGFPRYQELLGDNLIYNPTTTELNEKEQEIITKIKNGTYSLIIFGPPEWAISERILSNVDNETKQSFCQILVPNNMWLTEEGWHFSYFFFANKQDCQTMLEKMYYYYNQNYQEICTKDKSTANMITSVLRQNGLPFDKTCTQGGESLTFLKKGYQTKQVEIIIMILLFALPLIILLPKHNQIPKENQKKYYILLTIIILIIIYLWFTIDLFPYQTGIVQTITTGAS